MHLNIVGRTRMNSNDTSRQPVPVIVNLSEAHGDSSRWKMCVTKGRLVSVPVLGPQSSFAASTRF